MATRNKVVQVMKAAGVDPPATVFDIGSNVGQSIKRFQAAWPYATVYGFEPVKETFARLAHNVGGDDGVILTNAGLSRESGERQMIARGASTGNRVVPISGARGTVETVKMIRGDEFMAERGIEAVDFMKIDAEGHDLDVLIGFVGALRDRRIGYVQVEVGVSPDNVKCVPYDRVAQFMFAFGYRLYGVYGFQPLASLRKREPGRAVADYADAVFVAG
jgi:FkbM family methyltransferase